jgi:hypothetical protein
VKLQENEKQIQEEILNRLGQETMITESDEEESTEAETFLSKISA